MPKIPPTTTHAFRPGHYWVRGRKGFRAIYRWYIARFVALPAEGWRVHDQFYPAAQFTRTTIIGPYIHEPCRIEEADKLFAESTRRSAAAAHTEAQSAFTLTAKGKLIDNRKARRK